MVCHPTTKEGWTMPQPSADLDRDRAIRLFTFLKRLSELRTKQIRSIDEYERVLWIADIPAEPGMSYGMVGGVDIRVPGFLDRDHQATLENSARITQHTWTLG